MSRKKLSPLVQAINIFNLELSVEERTIFAEYVRSQQPRQSKKKRPQCADCGLWSTDKLHADKNATLNLNGNVVGYHPFASPSPAPSAGKKSRKLKEFQLDGGASSATEKEIATSVGGSGD